MKVQKSLTAMLNCTLSNRHFKKSLLLRVFVYTGLNQIGSEIEMSTKLFTSKEINALRINPYVKSVSPKGITYTDDSKNFL